MQEKEECKGREETRREKTGAKREKEVGLRMAGNGKASSCTGGGRMEEEEEQKRWN